MEKSEPNINETQKNSQELIEDEWMIRPCDVYKDEYKDCRSIKSRFQQYFVWGVPTDCTQWKRDADNCRKWDDYKDLNAARELIESERQRRLERLRAHYKNDVWKKRKSPPADWDRPLPEHLQKEYENSYLNVKAMEMRGEVPPQVDFKVPSINPCVIL